VDHRHRTLLRLPIPSFYARILLTTWSADRLTYNQTWGAWYFKNATITNWQQYFMKTPIQVYTPAGVNCSLPFVCRNQNTVCGFAPACRPNIIPYLNVSVPELLFTPVFIHYYFGIPFLGITYNMVNQSLIPSPMEAVFTYVVLFASIDAFLSTIADSKGARLAVILNDADLTAVGSVGDPCAPGAPTPGPASQPTWSIRRTCDNRTRAIGNWIWNNRATLTNNQTTVLINDTLWDVFASTTYGLNYYVAVGMELSAMYGAIWASKVTATAALGNLSASQSAALTALSVHTDAYMQGLEAANLRQIHSTYTTLVAELASLTNSSQSLLNSSQAASTATISHMLVTQMTKVNEVQTTQLTALNVTTAWTIAVVVGIFLIVLLVSAVGTMRLTASLAEIIALMESVAEMNVEQLEVPQDAPVVEVARIQRAFHVLVKRLVEYKTYMPAALFNAGSGGEEDLPPLDHPSKRGSTDSSLTTPLGPGATKGDGYRNRGPHVGGSQSGGSSSNRKIGRRNVAVLVVNILRFRDYLAHEPNLMSHFSVYVKTVHRAVSQARGNIDSIVGDQILVTFNAHISCGDPVGAAVAAALELTAALKTTTLPFRCQMGISCGPMLYGSAGYANFRTLVALGAPMKLASLLSRLSQFDSEVVLCDASVAERVGFTHTVNAVDLVTLPRERPHPRSYAVYAVSGKKNIAVDEWMYQLDQSRSTWETAFAEICRATTMSEVRRLLSGYQHLHPDDANARRLASRLHAWTPGLGLALCDAADVAAPAAASQMSLSDDAVVELEIHSQLGMIGSGGSRKL
jgi:class 3 adenylate cyclase